MKPYLRSPTFFSILEATERVGVRVQGVGGGGGGGYGIQIQLFPVLGTVKNNLYGPLCSLDTQLSSFRRIFKRLKWRLL